MTELKKRIPALCLMAAMLFFCAQNVFAGSEDFTDAEPFALSPALDAPLAVAGVASCVTGILLQKLCPLPDADASFGSYKLSDVNALDAFFARPYSSVLNTLGDVTCVLDVALPAMILGIEWWACSNFPAREFAVAGLMYAESFALSWGIKNILKFAVHRVRPYMYFGTCEPGAMESKDFEFSWPSGHSTNVFMSAAFTSYMFCKYYPDSSWRIPVVAISYSLAFGTAALRMASGNHFLTDVLSGAVLGSACGFLVPFAHSLLAKSRGRKKTENETFNLQFLPGAVNVSIKL